MCFWLIINIYKIILLIMLKAEMYISPLNLHLDSVVSQALKRMKKSDMTHQIEAACTVIKRKLCWKKQNHQISLTAVAHLKFLSVNWTQSWILLIKNAQNKLQNSAKKTFLQIKNLINNQKISLKKIKISKSTHKMLKLYKKLFKTWNFIVIQLQLDKIKLTVFCIKKISDFFFSDCFCE